MIYPSATSPRSTINVVNAVNKIIAQACSNPSLNVIRWRTACVQ